MYFNRIFIRFIHSKPTSTPFNNLTVKTKKKAQSELLDLLITMPKEQPHIPALKSARVLKKELGTKYPAGFITLQILGNGSKGAPSSLYMFTDQTRYLFNCGEGSQRLAHEHKMKLAKLEHVFVTNSSWKQIGGLPGVALTIQDIGVPCITLHGPPNLEKLFEGTRRFVILKNLQIKVEDCVSEEEKYFEDSVMRVDYVPIYQETSASESTEKEKEDQPEIVEEDQIDYYAPIKGCKRHLEITQGAITKKPKTTFEENQNSSDKSYIKSVLAYICRPKKKAGSLQIDKCMEFGVPAGPLLGKLKSGEDVTLPNGKIVKAADVRTPDFPSPTFLVVDCPDESYLDSFVTNEKLQEFMTATSEDDFAHTIVHFTPENILSNDKYMEWMQKFNCSTRHILVNGLCNGMGSEAVHRVQYKLNLLDNNMFPLLNDSMPLVEGCREMEDDVSKSLSEKYKVPIMTSSTLFKYNLRPTMGPDDSQVIRINPSAYIKEAQDSENFPNLINELKASIAEPKGAVETGNEYPKIIFLGTGSCIPNKTRNTSGILVQVSNDTNIILDCGEGTYGQLVRFFGPKEINNILINLKAIYVSHLHADHHLGLINLLQHRYIAYHEKNLDFQPVYLIAPHQIQSWLLMYHNNFEPLKRLYDLVATTSLLFQNGSLDPTFETEFLEKLEMNAIETVSVRHCPNAYGIALTGKSGSTDQGSWKLTYSGDTMPCDYLVTLGQNSDILIHEATMEDELAQEALLKQHSTTSEAINIGKRMNAKFILLTHFSQRYAKVPKLSTSTGNGDNSDNIWDDNIGIAFDNMRVGLRDLPKIPKMYPVLKVLFADSIEEMEVKSAKKQFKKERELKKAMA